MTTVTLASPDDFDGFRTAARSLIAGGIGPETVSWRVAGDAGDLLGGGDAGAGGAELRVPKAFPDLARRVICHSDPERFALLHAALVALQARPKLLEDSADPLVRRLDMLAKAVGRDVHKMRAFVRFREVPDDTGERFAAWFEPEHHIVRLNAGFFTRRFTTMRFSILTPELCMHWDGEAVAFSPGAVKADVPGDDPLEATWKTYYASIFNPARLKINAMTSEMPKKYWKNLPEAALIPDLIAGAAKRTRTMIDDGGLPKPASLDGGPGPQALAGIDALRADAATCQRCPLWAPATQTVFGEGPADAVLMFVGEQPGDQEDLAGRSFVGPAGQVFDAALAAAGIDRARAYVTNAVKHFKFEPRGKRRIHAKPGAGEITACRWWLDAERAALKPRVIVALGATAARGVTGRVVTISRERGRAIVQPDGSELWITVHPSYLLRIEDPAAAAAERAAFIADLRAVAARVTALS
ncbi:UdgX family uracil-DNA binding protein [Polymorphobacter fuscus]|uniref:Type-4 uracil-DNA glycosylase n=1 Tax=Sandarakinorhabdus fusca TaxID=1439888 RepID=A0A7C9KXY3_9SPHN|nr:UdgX family uracil-DNA binding protein [Polymorphobacter fuscus]KAB7645473.1 UdgX family uracil-DNA binding protein [Polymorphobacter fuscus]MQT17902.1 UdgX family uracil-DNA binding protein [Polymorphobacter fuscus]NJC08531.1 DNA polymerase [Polymorphobacter fuscus]